MLSNLKKKLIILSLCLATALKSQDNEQQIVQISIPKCGTHMLGKCIRLLTGRNFRVWTDKISESLNYYIISMDSLKILTSLPETDFWVSHLFYSKEYADYLNKKNFSKFFIYRDPRDQVISFAFFMLSDQTRWKEAKKMTFNELLLDIITTGKTFENEPPKAHGIAELYRAYLPWLTTPDVLHIRFEDLVGPKGRDAAKTQFAILQKISYHLNLLITDEKLTEIAQQLFGGSETFREGKIGAWKKYFNKEHIAAFKANAGDLLIDLGYEKDLNW